MKASYSTLSDPKRPESPTSVKVEHEVVSAFIAGDLVAFREIYRVYSDRMYRYCVFILGDAVLAQDALQETFIRVHLHRDQLREPEALKGWLLQVTRSVCLNLVRTSKFTPEFVYLDQDFDQTNPTSNTKELSLEGFDAEMPNQIFQYAFGQIAPIYREAFMLKEIEGFSYSEIAELTGTTDSNIKVRINRAKKMLRKLLAPHFREQFDEVTIEKEIRREKKS